jgi:hypothetical protein
MAGGAIPFRIPIGDYGSFHYSGKRSTVFQVAHFAALRAPKNNACSV